MPNIISREPWRIYGGSFDYWFDAPGDIIWARTYRGRNTQPLCGPNIVTIRGLGKRNIKLQVQINPGALRNTRKEAFENMANSNLLYTLIPPGGELIPVKFDPSVNFEERWSNGMRLLTVGFQEVASGPNTGVPPEPPPIEPPTEPPPPLPPISPPGVPPLIIWSNPQDVFVLSPAQPQINATVSWGGLLNFNIDNVIWITDMGHTTVYGRPYPVSKTISGSIIYTLSLEGPDSIPAGDYQWTIRPYTVEPYAYEPGYSARFTVMR